MNCEARKYKLMGLIGGGSRAMAFLEALDSRAALDVVLGVADPDASAAGLQFARERGIPTTDDFRHLYPLIGLEVLVEVVSYAWGPLRPFPDAVLEEVLRTRPPHVAVIDHTRASLVAEALSGRGEPSWAEEVLHRPGWVDYREIFESANDAIMLVDPESGHLLDANRKYLDLFGYTPEEALQRGKGIISVPPENEEAYMDIVSKAIASGEPHLFEAQVRDKAGRPFWVEGNARRIFLGGQLRVLIVGRDITERKQAEEELKRANEELERNSRLKDEFLLMASHELKTPVTSIKLYSSLAARRLERPSPDVENILGTIDQQADALVSLVNDLLDASRLQFGQVRLSPERFDLREIVADVCAWGQDLHPAHPLKCASPERPLVVEADKGRLTQVLQNLISNAVKYSPAGSPVEVAVEEGPHDTVTITVRDQGIGINPEDLPHIFERFYKPLALQAIVPGLGLGLYICKELVERHGGRIWAESEPGKGSTFHVRLPLAAQRTEGGASRPF